MRKAEKCNEITIERFIYDKIVPPLTENQMAEFFKGKVDKNYQV